jgi:hypothetical protein
MTDNGTVGPQASAGRVTVNPGDQLLNTWGNLVFDQSVNVFDTAAARDTQWPTAPGGACCYTVAEQTLWQYRAGAWVAIVGAAPVTAKSGRGTLAQMTATTNSPTQSVAGATDWLTFPAVTVDGTRRLKITMFVPLFNFGAAGDLGGLNLMEGATQVQKLQLKAQAAGGSGQVSAMGMWHGVPAAGTHTYKIQIYLSTGNAIVAGTLTANQPAVFTIEDIGT